MLTDQHILFLDDAIEYYNRDLPPLKEFVLPGGAEVSARMHIARAVARRAERSLVTLADGEPASAVISSQALQYLNRLSDLLFILARCLNRWSGVSDVIWSRDPAPTGAGGV